MAQSSTSNSQYEFLLHHWIKLALRWLSTLGEKTPTRVKKKNHTSFYRSYHFWRNHPELRKTWHLRSAIPLSPCLLSWAYSCPAGLHGARVDHSGKRKNVLVLRTVQLLCGLSLTWKIQKPCQMARTVAVRFWCYFWSPFFDPLSQKHTSVTCSRPEWPHNPLCWSCLVLETSQPTPVARENLSNIQSEYSTEGSMFGASE